MPPDMTPPHLALPQMTAQQRDGFLLACAAFARWGGIMQAQPSLPGDAPGELRAMRSFGRRLQAMATVLHRAADKGERPAAAPRRRLPPGRLHADGSRAAIPAPPAGLPPAPVTPVPAPGRRAGQPEGPF